MNAESVDTYISANKYPPQDAIKEYIKLLAPSKVVIKGEEVDVSFKNGAKHISHDIINNKGKIKPENIRRLKTFLENAKPSSKKYETDNKDFGKRSVLQEENRQVLQLLIYRWKNNLCIHYRKANKRKQIYNFPPLFFECRKKTKIGAH